MKHILLPCDAIWAALDIFSLCIFIVYLKFAGRKFAIQVKPHLVCGTGTRSRCLW